MKKSGRITILIVAGAMVLTLMLAVFILREPAFAGRSVSSWLKQLNQRYNLQNTSTNAAVCEALQAMGTNSFAVIQRELGAHDSGIKTKIIRLLAKQSLIKSPFETAELRRRHAVLACQVMGPLAKPLKADLAKLLNDGDGPTIEIADALAAIGPEVTPILLKSLSHTNSGVRLAGLMGLRGLGYSARSAVKPLFEYVKTEKDPKVQSYAHVAQMFIEQDPAPSVPRQIRALDDVSPVVRWSAARRLGSFGPAATSALPALQKALQDPNPDVRIEAAQAIQKINLPAKKAGD